MAGEFKQKYCKECDEYVIHMLVQKDLMQTISPELYETEGNRYWQCMSCDNDLGYGKES